MSNRIREIAKHGLAHGWRRIFGTNCKGSVAVLCYHSVNSEFSAECQPLHPRQFEEHLQLIKHEFQPLDSATFVSALVSGTALPERSVVLTFDDGYRDNFDVAFPLLEALAVPATFFLVTDFVSGELQLVRGEAWRAMSWQQVREMSRCPLMRFGAHGRTHRILSRLQGDELKHEVEGSKKALEDRLGRRVDFFAYPNGQGADISPASMAAVETARFAAAFSTFWRTRHTSEERFRINRVMVSSNDSVDRLRYKIEGAYDYLFHVHQLRAAMSRATGGAGVWR